MQKPQGQKIQPKSKTPEAGSQTLEIKKFWPKCLKSKSKNRKAQKYESVNPKPMKHQQKRRGQKKSHENREHWEPREPWMWEPRRQDPQNARAALKHFKSWKDLKGPKERHLQGCRNCWKLGKDPRAKLQENLRSERQTSKGVELRLRAANAEGIEKAVKRAKMTES